MRVKGGFVTRRRRKKVLKLARGQYGNRKSNFRFASVCVIKALQYAYAHRRRKKRDMRSLWITRINAAAREFGMSYSKFMFGLKEAGIDMNRKALAEIAVCDKGAFGNLVEAARAEITKA
jgi:large subunit ribosomal protein L20